MVICQFVAVVVEVRDLVVVHLHEVSEVCLADRGPVVLAFLDVGVAEVEVPVLVPRPTGKPVQVMVVPSERALKQAVQAFEVEGGGDLEGAGDRWVAVVE
jgi:hypothetical protein